MNLQDAVLAGRYAKALFQAAQEAKALDAVRKDLKDLAQAVRKDVSFAGLLAQPRAAADKKAGAAAVLGRAPHGLTDRFLSLLLGKKRVNLLTRVAELFDEAMDGANGLSRVQVRTSSPLTDAQAVTLSQGLEKALGTKVKLDVALEPGLLSGVVVRAGDRLWDLSLKGRLARLKEKLLETAAN
jgi:F-type H+-transporting ATPase subunit delta